MPDDLQQRIAALNRATLDLPVRRSLDDPGAQVVAWRAEPVEGGFGHGYGIFRLHGEARSDGEILPWSLILKVVGPESGSLDPSAPDYWQREVLVYQSGLLEDLPEPLAAPRCFDVDEGPNHERWLWLEDVVETEPVWSLERYGLAARHLGHFNGRYLTGRPIPSVPWLSADALEDTLALADPGIEQLRELSENPLFVDLISPEDVERALALWAERRRCLASLDRLPQTLCHNDAFRRNLLAREDRQGRAETVAIDWSRLGPAPVGKEIGWLFRGLRFVVIDIDRIPELSALIFDGYLAGLRDAGWEGDRRLARFGYTATAALSSIADKATKWSRIAARVAALPAGVEPPRLLNPGGPVQAAAAQHHLLDLGEEALRLLEALT